METIQMPHCCAVGDLGDFRNESVDELKDEIKYQKSLINPEDCYYEGPFGFLLATTIANQRNVAAKLRRVGFTVLSRFTNPKTKNRVTLWGKKL